MQTTAPTKRFFLSHRVLLLVMALQGVSSGGTAEAGSAPSLKSPFMRTPPDGGRLASKDTGLAEDLSEEALLQPDDEDFDPDGPNEEEEEDADNEEGGGAKLDDTRNLPTINEDDEGEDDEDEDGERDDEEDDERESNNRDVDDNDGAAKGKMPPRSGGNHKGGGRSEQFLAGRGPRAGGVFPQKGAAAGRPAASSSSAGGDGGLLAFAPGDFEGFSARVAETLWILGYAHLCLVIFRSRPSRWPFSWQSLLLFWLVHVTRLPVSGMKLSRWNELGPPADVFLFALSSMAAFSVLRRRFEEEYPEDNHGESAPARIKETFFGDGVAPTFLGRVLCLARKPKLMRAIDWVGKVATLPLIIFACGLIVHCFFTPIEVLQDDLNENISSLGASVHMAADCLALLPQFLLLTRNAALSREKGADPDLAVPWLVWMGLARLAALASGLAAVSADLPESWNHVELFYTLTQLFNVVLVSDFMVQCTRKVVVSATCASV